MPIPNPHTNVRMDVQLEPCDAEFINYCVADITEDGMLPFTLPPQSLFRIIKDAALWFYQWSDQAVQEKWLGIKACDLKVDEVRNKTIRLPDCIEAVMEIKQVNSAQNFRRLAKFMREPIYFSSAYNMLGAGGSSLSGLGNPYRLADRDAATEEAFARMYEVQLFKTLLQKGLRFDYNPYSKILVFLGRVESDIVLAVMERIPVQSLYNDIRFRKYVVGKAMMRLKKILSLFDFQYPGNIKLNFEEIEKQGAEIVEKIEEEIKGSSSASDIILMK